MALYHASGRESNLEELLTLYGNICPQHFRDMGDFREICEAQLQSLMEGRPTSQYLAFQNVRKEILDKLDTLRQEERGWLPGMRLLYDKKAQLLIVKLMVGAAHEVGARGFAALFESKWPNLYALTRVGSARFGDPGGRSKEGDVSYKPLSRNRIGDWPTFVIEVGVSESIAMLHADASFWLTKSGGQTHIVLVMAINKTAREILLERWECGPPRVRITRSSNCCDMDLIQSIELRAGVQYNGPPLLIPADKVYDNMPQNVAAGAFQITAQDLTEFSDAHWAVLH